MLVSLKTYEVMKKSRMNEKIFVHFIQLYKFSLFLMCQSAIKQKYHHVIPLLHLWLELRMPGFVWYLEIEGKITPA